MATKKKNSKIKTSQIGRVSFPSVFEKSDFNQRFELNLVWGPEVDLSDLENQIEEAIKDKWPNKRPRGIKTPLKDIDEKPNLGDFPEGSRFARFWRSTRPRVVNQKKIDIDPDSGEFYAGCYALVTYNVFAGEHPKGGPYVSLGLINVQKARDGEPFQGIHSDPDDDFEELADEVADLLD